MNNHRSMIAEQRRQQHLIASETTGEVVQAPPHGRSAMLLAGVIIGVLLVGVQLWMLTVALNLFLLGQTSGAWELVLISGLVFLGGVVVWRVMDRQPPAGAR